MDWPLSGSRPGSGPQYLITIIMPLNLMLFLGQIEFLDLFERHLTLPLNSDGTYTN
jgi:hypothetical protein